MGDFNARNTIWGDVISNRKGKELESIINDSRLKCLNDGRFTFQRNEESQCSVLDLSFVSAALSGSWDVNQGYIGGSRHFPVTVIIDVGNLKKTKFLSKNKLMNSLSKVELEPCFDMIECTMKDEIVYATSEIDNDRAPK
ncbi:uncharacterized protein LOC142226159 [Haematobia irritans]|uniref:uncharacterized protein LOC142226159 n=1 Tax=Haematobia irritans TaxID=7368 RepID=UPI003F501134